MDFDGVITPGVVRKLHNAILCLDEWYLVHFVRTVAITVEGIHRLLIVKTDTAILVLASLHAWNVESRMAAYLEMNLLGVGIMDMPDDTYFIIIKHIADTESEIVGIDQLRLCRRFKCEGDLTLALGDELEIGVAGKSVTRQVVFLSIDGISVVVHAADDGEEDG